MDRTGVWMFFAYITGMLAGLVAGYLIWSV